MLILGPKGFRKTPCGDEAAFSPLEGRHFLKLHAEFVPAFLQLFSTPFITSLRRTLSAQKVSVLERDDEFTLKLRQLCEIEWKPNGESNPQQLESRAMNSTVIGS